MSTERTLTVFCPYGLCNRLEALVSGLALAEASGRRFHMWWPITSVCAAPFDTLFSNDLGVENVSRETVMPFHITHPLFERMPDLLKQDQADLVIGHPTWLLRPKQYAGHAELFNRSLAIFNQLQPIPVIQAEVDAFRDEHFRTTMIGVHMRRGDFVQARPDISGNLESALAAVDSLLDRFPQAGILLCSNENPAETGAKVHACFVQRYGSQLAQRRPTSLERSRVEGVQQALVDLWLLRSTDALVGTTGSTFSELAGWGHAISPVFVGTPLYGYNRMERLARVTGVYTALRIFGRWRYGQDIPIPVLLKHFKRGMIRRIKCWLPPAIANHLPRK